jgi:TetR/AcrR family transcriptional regulator
MTSKPKALPKRGRTQARPLGTRGRPEQTRGAILKAAIEEFAREGVAGARTDAIARAAKVNKALLYYYFQDKETLYGAALDSVFAGLTEKVGEVLDRDLPPREKIRGFVGAHFDFIASHQAYPRMVQREMMRAGRSGSPHLNRIVERYLQPTFARLREIMMEGMERGEIRKLEPFDVMPSLVALNIFYFSSVPMMRLLMPGMDPLAPEQVARKRAAVLDFISAAMFQQPMAESAAESGGARKVREPRGEKER